MHKLRHTIFASSIAAIMLAGCQTGAGGKPGTSTARAAMNEAIAKEPPGAYFVGRRYYKKEYKFWGFIRTSSQPWSTAQLVMLNENTKLAPDREKANLGSDNNHEYKITGEFTGDTVYEPASNRFFPEFRLRSAELISETPAPIYREAGATDPSRRIIPKPY